jgi:dihydroflavonol-4-reductase
MKVLVTGGSGFLGAHAVRALVDAGHEVRVLARSGDKLTRALAPLGGPAVEITLGDVTDVAAVERAVAGCEGVLHAASVFAFDPRMRATMHATNAAGTELVLRAARARGCDPIVHVSSVVALMPRTGPRLDPHGPVGRATGAYSATKVRAEEIARRHQTECGAVTITYPGAIVGPFDPGPGEMVHMLRSFLGNQACFRLWGAAFLDVDVRWLARVHAALFVPGQGPRRVSAGGTFVPWADLFGLLRKLTGRALPMLLPTPKAMAMATGALADALQPLVRTRLPISSEATWFTFNVAPTDDADAVALAGPPPPLEETLADAIRWCVEAGHLPARWAGELISRRELAAGGRTSSAEATSPELHPGA